MQVGFAVASPTLTGFGVGFAKAIPTYDVLSGDEPLTHPAG